MKQASEVELFFSGKLGRRDNNMFKRPNVKNAVDLPDFDGDADAIYDEFNRFIEKLLEKVVNPGDIENDVVTLMIGVPEYGWYTAPCYIEVSAFSRPKLVVLGRNIGDEVAKKVNITADFAFNNKVQMKDLVIPENITIDAKRNSAKASDVYAAAEWVNKRFTSWIKNFHANIARKAMMKVLSRINS